MFFNNEQADISQPSTPKKHSLPGAVSIVLEILTIAIIVSGNRLGGAIIYVWAAGLFLALVGLSRKHEHKLFAVIGFTLGILLMLLFLLGYIYLTLVVGV